MSKKSDFRAKIVNTSLDTTSVTIAAGQTLSDAQWLDTTSVLGFRLPANWDGGNITFFESIDSDGTYRQLADSLGNIITISGTANSRTIKDQSFPSIFYGIPYIKLQCVSAVAANRVIDIIMADV